MVEMGFEWPMNFSHFILIKYISMIKLRNPCFFCESRNQAKKLMVLDNDSGRKFDVQTTYGCIACLLQFLSPTSLSFFFFFLVAKQYLLHVTFSILNFSVD